MLFMMISNWSPKLAEFLFEASGLDYDDEWIEMVENRRSWRENDVEVHGEHPANPREGSFLIRPSGQQHQFSRRTI